MKRLTSDMVLRISMAAVLFTIALIFAGTLGFQEFPVLMLWGAGAMGVVGYFAPRWFPGMNAWGWPFGWILLIPIVTTIWSAALLDHALDSDICTLVKHGEASGGPDIWRCPSGDAWPTLLPGLLNLVAFSWALSGRREVRWAALVAGTLGAVRLGAPLLMYRLSGAEVEIYGTSATYWFGPSGSVSYEQVSSGLWALSAVWAIAFLVGANVVESRKRKREQAAPAMQARAQGDRAQLLARLRDEGLITHEEYERKRRDLPSGT